MNAAQCAVVSVTDIELIALLRCARRRLVVIAPGLSERVAQALIETWKELGPRAVQVVLDPDPEVCRLGLGELGALERLHEAAEEMGTNIHRQRGLRIGVVVTDETTVIYSPTPLLIEAGGKPGEKSNALRLELPILEPAESGRTTDLAELNLQPTSMSDEDVATASEDLKANPPVKFDVAQKVRVFNARFEFVEFELRGLAISRKTARVPSDLIPLAGEPKARKLLRSSCPLIEENDALSGHSVNRLKQFIAKKYLIVLPGFGTVVLRTNKADFQVAVKSLKRYIQRFQRRVKKNLQTSMDANRELLVSALLPGVVASPPERWQRFLGKSPNREELERMLRNELKEAFGSVDDLFHEMEVKVLFKGVTYESLSDADFIRVAQHAIPSLDFLHEEFEAAKAAGNAK